MFFIIIRVRRKMRTGLLNVEKETKSTEPSTFGHVIFQNGARKGNFDFTRTVNTKGRREE